MWLFIKMVKYWDKYTEMHGQQNDKYTEMHGQQNDKYTEMHGQQNDKYTEMHGQQNDKYTEMHGKLNVKIRKECLKQESKIFRANFHIQSLALFVQRRVFCSDHPVCTPSDILQ